jgi:hypothetical protein
MPYIRCYTMNEKVNLESILSIKTADYTLIIKNCNITTRLK